MNYDAIIEQLETWAREIESAVNRHSELASELDGVVAAIRDVAADLARESDLPAEFRTWGPGDPRTRRQSLNEIIARLRSRDTCS